MDNHGLTIFTSGYAYHSTPFHTYTERRQSGLLIRLQVQGACQAILNGQTYSIQPGDLLFSKKGDSYRLIMEETMTDDGLGLVDSGDYFMYVEGDWIDAWFNSLQAPSVIPIEITDELLSLWRMLIYEKRNLHENHTEMIAYLVKLLCLTIERQWRKGSTTVSGGGYIPYKIKQYIERHATEPLSLKNIAQKYGISVSTASHLFKETFGQTPIRYAVDIRLSIASERILYSNLNLEDIAHSAGFQSYPYFCRAFKAHFNMSPSEFRKQKRDW
ncbi:AraC family transcriptional regulator [Paenibacillus sp. PL2-23]|uniref:AraC family transcriptional regulator n=1 Tax=Paenibacillus sp. PL2-23 TaxID=2100729 RepID=UPI0030F7CBD1